MGTTKKGTKRTKEPACSIKTTKTKDCGIIIIIIIKILILIWTYIDDHLNLISCISNDLCSHFVNYISNEFFYMYLLINVIRDVVVAVFFLSTNIPALNTLSIYPGLIIDQLTITFFSFFAQLVSCVVFVVVILAIAKYKILCNFISIRLTRRGNKLHFTI